MIEKPKIIIASHAGTDFDSLASMVAAHKLYPDSQPVLVAGCDINVREFMSLYTDVFFLANVSDADLSEVKTVIATDVGTKRRLGQKVGELLDRDDVKVILYDHHITEDKDFRIDELHQANFGSATTVVLSELLPKKVEINPMEATLFALGIYEDTGNLTYTTTTPRDLEIVAKLLKFGARLDIVTRFLSHQLNPMQRQLLQKLLLNIREMNINGHNITFTTAAMNVWVEEFALLTHMVGEMENADVVFALVEMKDKLYIVGRSRIPSVNVADVLAYFGGGGHAYAASATAPGGKINRALPSLIDCLRDMVPPGITARDIMSSPVVTIDPDEPITAAYEKMIRNGHSGLVVLNKEDDNIAGLISRKDVDKAISHDLGHAPLKSVMSYQVITVNERTTLDEMKDLLISHGVGRLPVMFGGKLIGIVTRSDILRAIHLQTQMGSSKRIRSEAERKILLNLARLAPEYKGYIEKAGEVGDRLGYQVFLVGGIVRDLIMARENLDLDFLVEGCGEDFSTELGRIFNAKVDLNERFGTAKIHIRDDFHLDVALCRCEYYRRPGALPEVTPSGLKDDLYRRDFTVNALAIRVNPSGFGELIDFFRGVRDLEHKIIRTLHPLSFVDDPTRIFRAIRFEGRLGFKIDDETLHQAHVALESDIFAKITPERIRHEMELILKENNPSAIILRGDDIGLWKRVDIALKIDRSLFEPEDRIAIAWKQYGEKSDAEIWRVYLPALFVNLSSKTLLRIIEDMNFDHNADEVMRSVADGAKNVKKALKGLTVKDIRKYVPIFSALRIEALVFLTALFKQDENNMTILKNYLENIRNVVLEMDGDDLIRMGHKPSALFKEAFREAYYMKLEGHLSGKKDELKFAHEYLLKLEKGKNQ